MLFRIAAVLLGIGFKLVKDLNCSGALYIYLLRKLRVGNKIGAEKGTRNMLLKCLCLLISV